MFRTPSLCLPARTHHFNSLTKESPSATCHSGLAPWGGKEGCGNRAVERQRLFIACGDMSEQPVEDIEKGSLSAHYPVPCCFRFYVVQKRCCYDRKAARVISVAACSIVFCQNRWKLFPLLFLLLRPHCHKERLLWCKALLSSVL